MSEPHLRISQEDEMTRILFGMILGVILGMLLCDALVRYQAEEGE